jgi:hypothetical protein
LLLLWELEPEYWMVVEQLDRWQCRVEEQQQQMDWHFLHY